MRKKYILALTSTAILLSLSNQMKVQASNEYEDLGITHENSDGSKIGGEDPVEYSSPTGLEAISLNSVIDSAQASPESPSSTQVNKKNDSSTQVVQSSQQDWRTHSNGLIYDEDLPASPIDQQEVPLIAAEAPGDKVGIRDINFYERLCDVYNIPYEEGKTFTVRHFRRLTELSPEVCVAHNTAEKSFQVSNIAGLEFAENLQKLSLANQPIGDISYISGLTNLAYIDMRNLQDSKTGQPITDYTPFENLVNLEFLNLAQSKPVNPEKLSNLSKLKHLNLMSSKIDDLSFATDMKELEYLNIQYSNISDLSPLAQATKLETLILDRQADSLTDSEAGHSKKITDLAMLDQLTKLKEISIDNHAVKDISVVSNWKNLTSFMAQNNDIQDLSPLLSLPLITGEVWVQGNLGLSGDTTPIYRQAKKLHMALEKPVYTSEDISAIDAILNASEDVKAFFNQEILEGLQIYKGSLQDGQQVDNQLIPFTSVSASGQWIQLEHRDEVNLLIVDDNNNKVFEPLEFQIYDNGYLIKNQVSEDGYLRLSASPIPYTIRAIHFNDQKVFELQTAGSHRIGTVQNHKGRIALNDQNQVDLGQYLTIQIPAETEEKMEEPKDDEKSAEVGLSGDRLTLRVLDQDGKLVTQPLEFKAGNLDVINNENGTYTFISDGSSDSHAISLVSDDYELVGDNALKTSSKTNYITGETFASFNLIKLKGDIVDESWTHSLNLELQVKDQPEVTEDQEQDETDVEINRPQENETQAEVGLSGDRLTLRVLDQDGKLVTQPLDFTAGNLDVINNENGTYTFISDGSSDSHAISLVSDDYELVGDNALKTSSKTNYITGETFASFNLIKLKGDIVDESWTHSLNLELQVKDQPEATDEHEKSDIDLPIIYMVRPSDLDLTAGQLEQTLKIFGSGLTKDLKLATYEGDQLVSDVGLVRVEGDKGGMKEVTIQVKENTGSDIKNYTTYFYYGNEINKNNPIIITVQPSPSQAIDILDFSTRQSAMKAENGSLVATLLADPIQSEHISFLVTADGQEIEQATTEWINVNEENNRAMVRFTVPDNSYPVERIYSFSVLVKGQPVDQARIEIKQNPKTVDPALLTLQVTGANYNEDRDHIHIYFDENIASHLPAHAMQKNIQYTTDRGRIDQLNFTPFSEGTTYSIDENTLTIKLNQAVPKDEVNLRVRVVAASIEGESGAFNPDVSRLVASYSSSLQAKLRTVHLSQTIFDKEGGPLSIHLIGDHLNEETAIEIFDAGSYKKNEELTSNVNYNLNEDNTLKAHVNLPANTSGQSQSYIIRPIHEGENLDLPFDDKGINRVDAIVVTVLAEGQQVDEPTLSAVTLSSYGVSNPDQPTHTVTAKNQESKKTILSLYGANLDELTTKIKLVDQNGIEWPIISAGGQLSGEFPMMVLAGESKVGNGIIGNGNYQIAEVILPGNLSEDMTFTYHVAVDGENYHPTITATGVVESTKNYGKEPIVRTLNVQYQDQNGDKIAEDRTLQGYSWFPYAIEVSQFDDYEFVSSKGDLEGEFGSQDQVIVLVYEKTTLPAMEIEDIADKRPDDTPEEPSVETPQDRPSDQSSEGSGEDEDGGEVDQPQNPSETDDKVSGSKEDSEEESPTPEIPQEGEGESNDLEGAPSEPRPETPQEDDESDDSEVTPEEPSVETPEDRPSDQPSEGSDEDEDGGQVDQPQRPSETDDEGSGSKEDSEEESPTPEIPQEEDEADDAEVAPKEPSVDTPQDRPSDQSSEGSGEGAGDSPVDLSQPSRETGSEDGGSTAGLAENTAVWIPIPLEGNRMAYAEQVSGGQLLIKAVNDQSEIFNRAQTALNGIADFDLYDIEFVDQNNNEVDINRPIKFRLAYDSNKNVKSVVYLGDHFEVARTLEFKDNKDENYVEISHETFSYFAVVYEEIDKQLIAKAESASDDNIETAEKDLDDNQPMSSQDISKESSNLKLPQTGATHVGLLGLSVATVLSGLGLVSKKRK